MEKSVRSALSVLNSARGWLDRPSRVIEEISRLAFSNISDVLSVEFSSNILLPFLIAAAARGTEQNGYGARGRGLRRPGSRAGPAGGGDRATVERRGRCRAWRHSEGHQAAARGLQGAGAAVADTFISWCAGAVVESFKIANRTVLDLLAEGRHGKGGTSHRHGGRGPRKIARASKTLRSRQRPPTTIIRYRGVTCIGHPVAGVILWRQPLVTTGGAVGYLPIGAFPIGALPT
jgi:hypothetical protein